MKTAARTFVGQALYGHRGLHLHASDCAAGDVLSPYFRLLSIEHRKVGNACGVTSKTTLMLLVIKNIQSAGLGTYVDFGVINSGAEVYNNQVPITLTSVTDQGSLESEAIVAAAADAAAHSYTGLTTFWSIPALADVNALIAAAIPPAPSSYQTIVSQTGTAAPAVSGSLAPISSYPTGTTFTWARSSAGVYTLTASTAVFNTSGKTGVFVAPLQNLNAQARGVVTSSTVITLTTAIGSLLGLGLLGLTATPTDALLSGTMIYVQTYS